MLARAMTRTTPLLLSAARPAAAHARAYTVVPAGTKDTSTTPSIAVAEDSKALLFLGIATAGLVAGGVLVHEMRVKGVHVPESVGDAVAAVEEAYDTAVESVSETASKAYDAAVNAGATAADAATGTGAKVKAQAAHAADKAQEASAAATESALHAKEAVDAKMSDLIASVEAALKK